MSPNLNIPEGAGFAYGRAVTDDMLKLLLKAELSEDQINALASALNYNGVDTAYLPSYNMLLDLVKNLTRIAQIDADTVRELSVISQVEEVLGCDCWEEKDTCCSTEPVKRDTSLCIKMENDALVIKPISSIQIGEIASKFLQQYL